MAESSVKETKAQGPSRIEKLDSIRGIAALMVLIGHCGGVPLYGLTGNPGFWWLPTLWDGNSAVVMFFLLSGYVLALQLDSPRRPTYGGFLVRRIFRIWPAFAVGVAISFLALRMTGTLVDAGPQNGPPSTPPVSALVQNLFMVGNPVTIDPPIWSLYVEARLSILFPLLLLLVRRLGMAWAIMLSGVLSILLSRFVSWDIPEIVRSLAEASRYVVLFVIGAALAQPANPLAAVYKRLALFVKALCLAAALLCLAYKFHPSAQVPFLRAYVSWVGMSLLFVLCLYSPLAERLLHHRIFLFLGRISYGLYLVHFPIMLMVKARMTSPSSTAVVLIVSVLGGWILNRWVEQPMIAVGRRLTSPPQSR